MIFSDSHLAFSLESRGAQTAVRERLTKPKEVNLPLAPQPPESGELNVLACGSRRSVQPFPCRATGCVRIVDSDVGGRSDDAAGAPLCVVAGPVIRPSLAARPAFGGEVQPGPLHPAAHRGRQQAA